MKKGIPVILVGLAGVAAQCIAFPHLLKIGTCASGGPYLIANPCPSGTATWILLLGGGMAVSILCIVAASFITSGGLFSGAGLLLWSAEFLGVGLTLLLTAILGKSLGGGAKSAGYSVGIIFIPMGGLPLLFGIKGGITGASRKPVTRRARTADATISAWTPAPPPATVPIPGIPGGASALPWASSPLSARPSNGGDSIGRLKQLADLHSSGALTDAEFQLEKSKILAEP